MILCPPSINTKPGFKKSRTPKIKFDPKSYKKMDQFIVKKTDTGHIPSDTVTVTPKSITASTVHASTTVHSTPVQNTASQNTEHGSTVSAGPNMQQADTSETHQVDNQQDSVVITRTRHNCLDRSRDCPDPPVSTHHTFFTITAQPVAHKGADNLTNSLTFTNQDQLAQKPEPESSRICK